jgi:hypothetical protein
LLTISGCSAALPDRGAVGDSAQAYRRCNCQVSVVTMQAVRGPRRRRAIEIRRG